MSDPLAGGGPLLIRPAAADDLAYVGARWVHSYSAARAGVSRSVYSARQPRLVASLLRRSTVHVLCSRSVLSALYGFAVAERGALHYVYVDPTMWRRGLGRALAESAGASSDSVVQCTHRPAWADQRLQFNPYLLMMESDDD